MQKDRARSRPSSAKGRALALVAGNRSQGLPADRRCDAGHLADQCPRPLFDPVRSRESLPPRRVQPARSHEDRQRRRLSLPKRRTWPIPTVLAADPPSAYPRHRDTPVIRAVDNADLLRRRRVQPLRSMVARVVDDWSTTARRLTVEPSRMARCFRYRAAAPVQLTELSRCVANPSLELATRNRTLVRGLHIRVPSSMPRSCDWSLTSTYTIAGGVRTSCRRRSPPSRVADGR